MLLFKNTTADIMELVTLRLVYTYDFEIVFRTICTSWHPKTCRFPILYSSAFSGSQSKLLVHKRKHKVDA